ncbi:MAG: methyl-accepting chemotaxis protein [Campylobacterales bacterium]
MTLKAKLGLLIVLMAIGLVVLGLVLLLNLESAMMEDRKAKLSGVVDTASSVVAFYHEREKSGELSREEAQSRAMKAVKALRYDGQEYFWINDMQPRMVMHPFNPKLDGQDLSTNRDPNGLALFVEMVKTVQAQDAGFVNYFWPKPGQTKPVEKVSYVMGFKPWGWVIGSGVYVDDVRAQVGVVFWQNARRGMLATAIILAVSVLAAMLIGRSIARPVTSALDEIAQSGRELLTASDQIAHSATSLAEGASTQASGVEQVSATVEESTAVNTQNAENAREANILANQANDAAKGGDLKIKRLMTSMGEITEASEQIAKIIKTIDEIAFQTNLLALNAAVEAARAGEHGLGFAVVADEVKNLAGRSANAAKETAGIIEQAINKIKEGNQIARETNESFAEILDKAKKTSDLIGEIAASVREQAEGMNQISQAMGQIDSITQQNAATSEEAAAAAEEMNAQANAMMSSVASLGRIVGVDASHLLAHQSNVASKSPQLPRRSF